MTHDLKKSRNEKKETEQATILFVYVVFLHVINDFYDAFLSHWMKNESTHVNHTFALAFISWRLCFTQ